ncbi:MAG: tetratricopeptide repeat protein [Ardenticatenaceae bacterium]|nr:tetratricopeptide repeat protein [Ardenticatenaceae bacterium]
MLQLQLLGSPQITLHGKAETDLSSAKSLALLYYLALHGRPQSRLALGGLLWPDKSDSEARMNLRQALYQLRQVLPDYVQASRQDVQLVRTKGLMVDVQLFEAALKPGLAGDMERLQTAVDHYQGDFLHGFFVDDAPDFEEWQLMERERLRSLAIQAMHQLSTSYAQQHLVGPGLLLTRRLIDIEPWREESHQLLMRLLAWDGQVSAALAQYEQCRQLLADELGVEPSQETQALFAQIKARETRDKEIRPLEVRHNVVVERPLPAPRHTKLPHTHTVFIGRERELEDMAAVLALPETRLLTVVGPGGMGKTRLTLALVERLLADEAFIEDVYFVPLEGVAADESVSVADQISLAIARTMDLSLTTGEHSPSHHLLTVLQPKRLLLVLDNFEHLLAGAEWVALLLKEAPEVQVVVTSRERLSLYGERVLTLRGLALPERDVGETAVHADALQLFIHAAQRVRHDFQSLPEERPTLVQLCRFLNGMPLAIELAASWVDTLSVADILAELQQDLDMLATDMRDVAARQRSIRQVFAYAWQRLSVVEQQVLAALSVFRGGFTRVAAQQVALVHTRSAMAVRLLADLVQKSLLHFDRTRNRYEMHSLLRQFLGEKLAQDGVVETAVYQRHSAFFCEFLQERRAAFISPQQQTVLRETEADIENIRIAWQWALVRRDVAGLGAAFAGLFHFYDIRSWFREGERVFRETAVALDPPQNVTERILLAQLRARQGWFAFHLGQHQHSFNLLQNSLVELEYERANDESIFNYNYLGAVLRHQGKYERANFYVLKALEMAQAIEDRYQASISFNILGQTVSQQGDYALAQYYCREGLHLKREMGDQRGVTYSLAYLGRIAKELGEFEEAEQLFNECVAISGTLGDQRGVALGLQNLGNVMLADGRSTEAIAVYQQGLAIFRKIGNRQGECLCLIHLGEAWAVEGKLAMAAEFIREGGRIALDIVSQPGLEAAIAAMAMVWERGGETERSAAALAFLAKNLPGVDGQVRQLPQGYDSLLPSVLPKDADAFVREYVMA